MNIVFNNCKEIIKKFLEKDNFNYPKEIKICKKLLNIYSFDFFIYLKSPFYPLSMKSLAWFLTEEGKSYLTYHYFEYLKSISNLTKVNKEIKLEANKIGEDLIIEKQPKSLNDFLNMFRSLVK